MIRRAGDGPPCGTHDGALEPGARKRASPIVGIALLLGMAACERDVTASSPRVERVDLQPYQAQLSVGDTVRFRAIGLRQACDLDFCSWESVPEAEFTWHLLNSDVAAFAVGSPGRHAATVRAVGPGDTWVVAQAQGASARAYILVNSPAATASASARASRGPGALAADDTQEALWGDLGLPRNGGPGAWRGRRQSGPGDARRQGRTDGQNEPEALAGGIGTARTAAAKSPTCCQRCLAAFARQRRTADASALGTSAR
jgi:hypothetical protein